ncbi:hypothetical protein Tco_0917067, partial [Tanacetum coccineum]
IKSDAKGLLEALKSTVINIWIEGSIYVLSLLLILDLVISIGDSDLLVCKLSCSDILIFGTYRCVLSYRLGVPFFSVPKPCSACSSIFAGNIYGDHSISCVGIVGIKHRHNIVGDTLVDICFRSRISASLSPLTQTGMIDFVPGCAVIEAAKRKRIKYEAKCANIRYGFLPFSFYSSGELEKDTMILLKRIQKFFVTQDIGA